jgi:hypothetical protein
MGHKDQKDLKNDQTFSKDRTVPEKRSIILDKKCKIRVLSARLEFFFFSYYLD